MVDCNPKFQPTICCDVKRLEPNMVGWDVDLIWASPPCTHYSIATMTAVNTDAVLTHHTATHVY